MRRRLSEPVKRRAVKGWCQRLKECKENGYAIGRFGIGSRSHSIDLGYFLLSLDSCAWLTAIRRLRCPASEHVLFVDLEV